MINNHDKKVRPIFSSTFQADTMLERVHLTIENILHTSKAQDMVLDNKNALEGILASAMFALMTLLHTTTQCIPAQLVFGQDSFLKLAVKKRIMVINSNIIIEKIQV